MHRSKKKRNIIIISLVGILLCMVVGYAAFQTQLKVTGSSTVTSNWDIEITNVTAGTPTGSAENAVAPSFDKLWASMEANLYDKGDAMEYDVTIENKGTLDAKLNDIITNLDNSNNEAVLITFSGYTKGEVLKAKTSKVVHVKIEYNPEYEGGETSSEVEINFDYGQNNNEENNPDNQYLLTYDYKTNGGTNVELKEEYLTVGSNVDLTNAATKEGWTFVGWNTNKDAETGLESYQMPNSNITLYAIYSKTLKVTYQKGENIESIGKVEDSCNIYNNNTSCEITLPSIIPNKEYIVDGWYNGSNKVGNPNDKYNISSNTTLTSKSILETISVTISTTSTINSITVIANAQADSGIAKYEYSIDNGKTWEEGTSNTYTFTGLTAGTSYDIKVRVTSNVGKTLEKSANVDITNNIVTEGDGLYEDEYEEGRYIYKGTDPNNYIWFNDEMWRIVAKETDGTYKIINMNIPTNMKEWDFEWAIGTNSWTRPADLNTYLNNEYFNNLSTEAKSQIISHTWNIGPVIESNTDLAAQITSEKSEKYNSNVGLISVSDYIRSNSNTENCGTYSLHNSNLETCKTTNWLIFSGYPYWTINYESPIYNNGYVYHIGIGGEIVLDIAGSGSFVLPTVFLNSNITLSGTGTYEDPYKINQGVSTSTLEKPTFTESGTYGKTVTITYPKGCGTKYTCTYQKNNGEIIKVTEDSVNIDFTYDGNIIASISDGTNENSSSYGVNVITASDQLEDKVITTGQGIYKDIYEENHYVFKGANPKNYISFNNELWRIISTEEDDTIKIIRNESIGEMPYDVAGSRSLSTNTGTYCTSDNGCNAYGVTNDFGGMGTVLKDSTLNTYLNGEYYNKLSSEAKSFITEHDFDNGPCGESGSLDDKIYIDEAHNLEKKIVWHGEIGLMNLTDFLRSTSNTSCDSIYSGWHDGYPCHIDNYLFKDGEIISTMSSSDTLPNYLWSVNNILNTGGICSAGKDCGYTDINQSIYPVVYIKNTIYLTGDGTESSPYKIHEIA